MIRLRRTIVVCAVGLVAAITALSGYESARPADAAAPRASAAPTATLLVLGDSLTWGSNYFAKLHARLSALPATALPSLPNPARSCLTSCNLAVCNIIQGRTELLVAELPKFDD